MSDPKDAATEGAATAEQGTEGQENQEEQERETTPEEVQEAFNAGLEKSVNLGEEPQEPEAPKVLLNYTAEEVEALLGKAKDIDSIKDLSAAESQKLYGKIGEIQRDLKRLQSGASTQPVKVTSDKLAKLNAEFPEIAAMLAEDLSSIVLAQSGTSADMSQVEELVKREVGSIQEVYERKLLKRDHPDWEQVVKSQEFASWLKTKAPEDQARIGGSDDADVASEAITEFKEFKKKSQPPATGGGNNKRLEAAITPRGTPTPATRTRAAASYEDAFNEGLKKAQVG